LPAELRGALPVLPVLVVELALLRVAKNLVGLADLLELRLRRLVVRVHVGVVLPSKPTVGRLDLLLVGVAGNPQHNVIVLRHQSHLRSIA
jgi:hypothetical protein